MTFQTLDKLEEHYKEPENEGKDARKKRLKNRRDALKRFNERQQSASASTSTGSSKSKTTVSATLRKQQSRAARTSEQIEADKQRDKIDQQDRYKRKKEQLRTQFLKIGHCEIDEYDEDTVKGDDVENKRHKFGRMDELCARCFALKWKNETKGSH